VTPVQIIAAKIRALTPPADISLVMQQVEELLDRSIAADGYIIREAAAPAGQWPEGSGPWLDLSRIDFEALAERFKSGRKRTLNEKLKGLIAQKLVTMVRFNRTRMNYLEQFQALIDAYNAGSSNAETLFQQLVAFTRSLNQEEQRAVSEQLDEEELALFDLLTKPRIDLDEADRQKVKAAARDLLATLKAEKLVLDWRKRQQARAEVRVTIERLLDERLPRAYTPELFEQKSTAVYQHVYEAYYGAGRSIYAP
jgi:type I restriction enzyme, R subunit